MRKRIDQHLVDLGFAPSKTKAQEMIELGQVKVISIENSRVIGAIKAAKIVDLNQYKIQIVEKNITQYVARSGFKLVGAIEQLGLEVQGLVALDVGQSTGGFTDCLLQMGVQHVFGVDVGVNQLAAKLRNNKRVTCLEKINAKDLVISEQVPGQHFDLAVVDVSFISLTKVLSAVLTRLRVGGGLLALVKPQFEVGSVNIGKNGLVKGSKAVEEMKNRIIQHAEDVGLVDLQYISSPIKGRDGNQEYFIYGIKK